MVKIATTKKFAKQIEKLGKDNINFWAYDNIGDFILKQNNREIGRLLDNRCYLIATPQLQQILKDEVLVNSFDVPIYDFIEFRDLDDKDLFDKCIRAIYDDLYRDDDLQADFSSLYHAYQNYPQDITCFYNIDVLFLKFCYDNGLLLLNPLDEKQRIIKFAFYYKDLTEKGKPIFALLRHKFLAYMDRNPKNPKYEKMLEKYLAGLLKSN